MSDIDYQRLETILSGLGFVGRESKPSARVYFHPPSGAKLYYPAGRVSDHVLEHHLQATRMTLDQFGIASPSDFDGWLQRTAG
jgi:hypothetical protein